MKNSWQCKKTDTSFLFLYKPLFKYAGSFEVSFPRNKKFSSPKVVLEYLNPLIGKIARKNEYLSGYELDKRNMNDQTKFIITISGSKKLFDTLELDNLKKENWQPTVESGWFFYRTR